MASESLRADLEAVYTAHVQALKDKDLGAFVATIYGAEMAEGLEPADFAEAAEFFLQTTPELSQTSFVDVRTQGEDLAGYYCIFRDPDFANVLLMVFLNVEGQWKLHPQTSSFSFQPEPGEDLQARAKELIETEDSLQLQYPAPPEAMGEPGGWDTEVAAALDCMAYDYELTIAINGVRLDFGGGMSESARLFGVAAGAEPAAPAVLRVGENQIDLTYRKTNGKGVSQLSVEIRAMPDRLVFRLVTTERQSGEVSATFHIPASEDEEVEPVLINADEG